MTLPFVPTLYLLWQSLARRSVRCLRSLAAGNGHLSVGTPQSLPPTRDVRALALTADGASVLLVEHTYIQGWYLPGGGVKKNETPREALARELWEETGVTAFEELGLLGTYKSRGNPEHGTVQVFVVKILEQKKRRNWEIHRIQAFPWDALPSQTSPATRKRILEYLKVTEPSAEW